MRACVVRFLCLLLCAALAGCEQLPQPFQPEKKSPAVFADRISQSRIAVLPFQSESGSSADLPGNPRLAAEILADALEEQGLLATPGHASEKMRRLKTLVRRIDEAGNSQTHETLEVEWTLFDPNGFEIDSATERFTLLTAAWEAGNPQVLEELAAAAAPQVAAFLQAPQTQQAGDKQADAPAAAAAAAPAQSESPAPGLPGFPDARLAVLPVEGAPGDGSESLRQALQRKLLLAGLPLAERPATGDLVVRGIVALRQVDPDWQEIAIVWRLEKAASGGKLGEVSQVNRVPAGSLDTAWGSAADGAAQGAAEGLQDLLAQLSDG
ncbi:MAG: hypothetical protein WD489_03260 [Rhodovibrionaceae bacterium]